MSVYVFLFCIRNLKPQHPHKLKYQSEHKNTLFDTLLKGQKLPPIGLLESIEKKKHIIFLRC